MQIFISRWLDIRGNCTLPEMGPTGKKFATQKIIGKYLQIPGGDFYTPLS